MVTSLTTLLKKVLKCKLFFVKCLQIWKSVVSLWYQNQITMTTTFGQLTQGTVVNYKTTEHDVNFEVLKHFEDNSFTEVLNLSNGKKYHFTQYTLIEDCFSIIETANF